MLAGSPALPCRGWQCKQTFSQQSRSRGSRTAIQRVHASSDPAALGALNGQANPADDLDPSHPATVEMLVMDDLHSSPASHGRVSEHTRRLVPAPRRAAALLASKLALARQNGTPMASPAAAAAELDSAQQRAAAAAAATAQSAATKALRAELGIAQAALQETKTELHETRVLLARRDAQVGELQSEITKKDLKLNLAREELLETQAQLAEKDEQLLAAYESLTAAAKERAAMRAQLVRTHTELSATRNELQSLAQDILELKSVMESMDSETDGEFGEDESAAAVEAAPRTNGTTLGMPFWPSLNGSNGSSHANGTTPNGRAAGAAAAASGGQGSGVGGRGDESDAATLSALSSLVALTQQMAADAQQDAGYYSAVNQLREHSSEGQHFWDNSSSYSSGEEGGW